MKEKEITKDDSSPEGRLGGASYTWVLLANAAYILVFYLLMKIFN